MQALGSGLGNRLNHNFKVDINGIVLLGFKGL